MKKMIIVASIALIGACTYASQVKWAVTQVKNGDEPISGAVAYLFNVADYSAADIAKDAAAGTLDTSKALMTATTGATGGISVTSGTLSLTGTQTFVSVIYNTATASGSSKAIITDPKEVTMKTTGSTSVNFGSQAAATWTVIPEPTTVALLALGLAALGLKRKVA